MPRKPWEKENWRVSSWLTAVCFAFFLLSYQDAQAFAKAFSFDPSAAIGQWQLWRFLTYPFSFGGPISFLFAVFILMVMGTALEAVWGSAQFLVFLLVSVVGASGMAAILDVPLSGMIGLDFNMLVAYAIHFPEAVFLIWFVVPVKARWLAIFGAAALVVLSLRQGFAGIAMMLGTSSGLVYWAVRLRAGRAIRVAQTHAKAVSAALVPRRDPAEDARRAHTTVTELAARAASGQTTEKDATVLSELKGRVSPLVNVCPVEYFQPLAEFCTACNGYLECTLRASGLSDLPARKPGGTTATGAADALSAHHAREREAHRRARLAARPRPATEGTP